MKLALLTQYLPTEREDYSQLFALTGPNRDEYCARHGYEHVVQRGVYKDAAFYYAYDRLHRLRDLLVPGGPDIVWTLNVQAVISHLGRPLEPVLDDEHDFWVVKDSHGLNLGSFVARNTEWTRSWLDFIISLEPQYRNRSWKEQQAIMDWWQHERWTYMIHLLPQRAISSYLYDPLYKPWTNKTPGQWRKGDLCLSLPGLNLQQRLDIVRDILAGDMIYGRKTGLKYQGDSDIYEGDCVWGKHHQDERDQFPVNRAGVVTWDSERKLWAVLVDSGYGTYCRLDRFTELIKTGTYQWRGFA